MHLERLQKVLAAAGIASRRNAEKMIEAGRVRVNGVVVDKLGTKVDPQNDRVEVDGKIVTAEELVVVLINKPRGVVCTASDPEGRTTIVDLVKKEKVRLYPVGRLDWDTSGALLLTNDGDLAFALTHPRYQVPRKYLAKIRGRVSNEILDSWRKGVDIGDPAKLSVEVFRIEENESYTWIEVTAREGRNRMIRRMAEASRLDLIKLKRISFAGLGVKGLRIGEYRTLKKSEIDRLKRAYAGSGAESKRPKKASKKRGGSNRAARSGGG